MKKGFQIDITSPIFKILTIRPFLVDVQMSPRAHIPYSIQSLKYLFWLVLDPYNQIKS